MQSITTKVLPCTNTKPTRIVAVASGGARAVVSADGSDKDYGHIETHAVAVRALCVKLGWSGEMVAGNTKDGFAFVFAEGCKVAV